MTAKECIKGRRSIRQFTDQPVSRELLAEIVETASFVPSWKHTQIVRYIAVEGELKSKIAKCTSKYPHNGEIIENAPVLIAVTFIKGRSGFERDGSFSTDREAGWQYYDCGIACQTLCLAAHDLGLGTVVMGVFDRKGLEAYLQIPEDQELMALIALGYPDESPAAPRRKETSLLLSYR